MKRMHLPTNGVSCVERILCVKHLLLTSPMIYLFLGFVHVCFLDFKTVPSLFSVKIKITKVFTPEIVLISFLPFVT